MKKIGLSLFVLVAVSLLFFGCTVPWDMGANLDSIDEEVVYVTGYNGQDTETLNFVDSTYTAVDYKYGYATEAAETSGKYTDKTWFQNDGTKGTFTYDNDTRLFTLTITQVYQLKEDAASSYAADYEWHTLTADDASYTKTAISTVLITQDGMKTAYVGSDADGWVYTSKTVDVDGYYEESSMSLSINGTTVTTIESTTSAEKDAAASDISHSISTRIYTLSDFFLVGEDTADQEFADVWKEGNTVSLNLTRTKATTLNYTGTTVPTIPTADTTTGMAETGTYGVDFASVNLTSDTFGLSFTHLGDCILLSEELSFAERGLE